MLRREDFADLALVLVVSEEGSFTAAANRLGMSQSGLSHSVRRLEDRLGIRLLARTTRSVSVTPAGMKLLEVLSPAMQELNDRLSALSDEHSRPSGTIRITAAEHATKAVLWPVVSTLLESYPDLEIELHIDNSFSDIISDRFDAGVRIGEQLQKDMIAVPIGPDMRMIAFASPDYIARRGCPETPHDLSAHCCINMRFVADGQTYSWEFEKDGRPLNIRVEGQLVLNSAELIIRAAREGRGIGFMLEDAVTRHFEDGTLVPVLAEWCPTFDGYYLYYPTRRQNSAAFRLLVDALQAQRREALSLNPARRDPPG